MRPSAESFAHRSSEIVDTVNDLAQMSITTANVQMTGSGVGVAARLAENPAGEEIARTLQHAFEKGAL